MSLNELTLQMIFTGEDRSGNAIQSVEHGIMGVRNAALSGSDALAQQTDALNQSRLASRANARLQRDLRRDMYQANEQFFAGTRLVGMYGNAAMKVNSIITSHNVLQIRKQQLQDAEGEAYQRLADAIRRYGANSDEARKAAQDLMKARKANADFAREEIMQYVGMGLALTSLAGDIGRIALETKMFMTNRRLGLFGRPAGMAAQGLAAGGGVPLVAPSGLGKHFSSTAAGAGGVAAAGLAGKVKSFAGSTAGKVLIPLAAGAATYGFLTETEEGREINRTFNPFTHLFDAIFRLTHDEGQIAAAEAARDNAVFEEGQQAGMNINGNVYILTNSASPAEVQASIEQYGATYR
jgi:hypothetical protein